MTPALNRRNQVFLGIGIITVAVAIFFALSESKRGKPLPVLKQLPEFTLTNQLDQKISLADLRGKICIADIVFTRCAGPCPRMTKQLQQIQAGLAQKKVPVHLVTLTADPEFDTSEVLKEYGKKFGANPDRCWFLTGPKKEVYRLAMDGLMLGLEETTPEERASGVDLFIHSTIFVLVDKKGQARAIYESTEPDTAEKIAADVRKLMRER